MHDFWYSGVFEHEKSIGATPEFQKNFLDPISGYPMLKNKFFNMGYPDMGFKKFFWNSELAPTDFSCPKTPPYQKSANLKLK